LSLNALPEAIKAECRRADNYSKRQLLAVLRAPSPESQLALWAGMRVGAMTGDDARRLNRRSRAARPKPYQFKYRAPTRTFVVRVTFRKSRASSGDVKDALREALKSVP
jgi:hypothetical protein